MYPAPSARWLAALRESHVTASRAELHWPDGTVTELPHISGSVTVDRGAQVRRTATVEVPDPGLLPATAADYLAVAGLRIRLLRGLVLDGEPQLVPVFYGRLDSVEGDPDTGPVTLSASGLEALIVDARFEAPYSTRGSTAAVTSITALIRSVIPGAVITSTAPNTALGARTWDAQDDRWDAIQEIATAVGADVWAGPDGVFHIAPLAEVATADPVWEIAAGDGGALIEAGGGWSRQGIYNVVVAEGENLEENVPPVSATVEDDDPGSPTWVGGPFGRVPRFYASPTLTTVNAATTAALKLLREAVKPSATADITSLPNPLLEPGDVVRVVYGSGRSTLHQIQSLAVDLGSAAMTLTMIGGKEDS
ncbi:DUF5047 domain-containing protein [Streptomyces sp. OF3]|uniref:DUF5047 domain-containing protein n=1 Tax=Streptomyces alkaliterrae TaxID=2213162 RepID=A0A7W3ZM50_9ACTN|nr:DUF5047 domain-containing protein [Streptomyces alkaliterrae]MBB1253165.1 DUF5047 domain-containing protein [Streptomyces alkaliterrae]